jgi:hypothetical protein
VRPRVRCGGRARRAVLPGLLALLCLAQPQPALAAGLDLTLELLYAAPRGEYRIEGFRFDATDLVSEGYGLTASVLRRFGRHLAAGLALGAYRTHGGDLFRELDLEARLLVVPVHAVVEGRLGLGRGALYLRQGLGLTILNLDAGGVFQFPGLELDLDRLDRSETNVSFVTGAGLSYRLAGPWSVQAGVQFHQTFTVDISENAVRFLQATAGLRCRLR